MLSMYSSNDIHFSDFSSLLHAIIQQIQITILLKMKQDADFVFQRVKSFLGSSCHTRHILPWQMFSTLLLVTVTSADTDTHSYKSILEFGLSVFNGYSW